MHGVTGTVRNHRSQNLLSDQRQITNQVQHLVPDKLIDETQRGIEHIFAVQHNCVVGRGATNQPLLPHRIRLMQESKRARGRNLLQVTSICETHAEALLTNQRMRKVNGIRNRVGIVRIDRNELVAFP